MSLDQDVVLLQGVPTFDVLTPEALRILAISAEQRRLQKDEVLFRTGDVGDCGYVVMSGRLEVFTDGEGRRRKACETLPGALIGEMALIVERPRPASAVALEASLVMRIPRTTFVRVLEGFPDAAVALRDRFSERVNGLLQSLDTVRDRLETPLRPAVRRRTPAPPAGKTTPR